MGIYDFPLVWRWTQQSHAVFPASVLAELHPSDANDAVILYERVLGLCTSTGNLSPKYFCPVVTHSAACGFEDGRSWLRQQCRYWNGLVEISWGKATALETTWEIFSEHWDDFCYPSSDDVSVCPTDESWILLYHRDEEFEFGRKK